MAILAISVLVHQDFSALRFYWLIRINCNSGILNNAVMQFSLLPMENEIKRMWSRQDLFLIGHSNGVTCSPGQEAPVTELPPQPFQKPHTPFWGVESASEIKGIMTQLRQLTESSSTIFLRSISNNIQPRWLCPEFPHHQYTFYPGLPELFVQKMVLPSWEDLPICTFLFKTHLSIVTDFLFLPIFE